MTDLFGWVALTATCLAAVITAANLGARITGYGFAVFFLGALAWCAVGAATGQRQLFWSNAFLALVDVLGVWRWLYRRARAEDAVARSKDDVPADDLFALDDLAGKLVVDGAGDRLGSVEGALVDGNTGTLRFLVVRPESSVDEVSSFKRLQWRHCRRVGDDRVTTSLTATEFGALPAS